MSPHAKLGLYVLANLVSHSTAAGEVGHVGMIAPRMPSETIISAVGCAGGNVGPYALANISPAFHSRRRSETCWYDGAE